MLFDSRSSVTCDSTHTASICYISAAFVSGTLYIILLNTRNYVAAKSLHLLFVSAIFCSMLYIVPYRDAS